MYDYKWAIQMRAEELAALENEDKELYDLPQEQQMEIYGRALDAERESLLDRADQLRDQEKERGGK